MSRLPQAFADNGFYVFRGVFSAADCDRIASRLRADLVAKIGRSVPDAVNKFPWLTSVLTHSELLDCLKQTGLDCPQFLQVADIQLDHNRDNWHRDSAVRVFGGADWDESREPYGCRKAIIYLEIDRAGLAVIPGTHRHTSKVPKNQSDVLENYLHIQPGETVIEKTYAAQPDRRAFIEMGVGDVLVFDERLLHCGRRLNPQRTAFLDDFVGHKSTLGFVYGPPSRHAWRFHSYFRFYRKELKYAQLRPDVVTALAEKGVLPDFWDTYIGDAHPDEAANFQGK